VSLDIEKAKSESKGELTNFLKSFDIDDEPIIANIRKSRKNIVGYYSSKSQFRGGLRIVVDFKKIMECEEENPLIDSMLQINITVFHEYAHSMAEYIEWIKTHYRFNKNDKKINEIMKIILDSNLSWQQHFCDEEVFAEDFAEWAVLDFNDRHNHAFWSGFMKSYSEALKIDGNNQL
jgi:hypothetical protein